MLALLLSLLLSTSAHADCARVLDLERAWLHEVDLANLFWSRFSLAGLQGRLDAPGLAIPFDRSRFEWMVARPSQDPAGRSPTYYLPDTRSMSYSPSALLARLTRFPQLESGAFVRLTTAHEMGHHLQELLGLMDAFNLTAPFEGHELFFRLELNADCLAGYYLSRTKNELSVFASMLELSGSDMTEGIARLTPELIRSRPLHPSGYMRRQWLARGYYADSIASCQSLVQPIDHLL